MIKLRTLSVGLGLALLALASLLAACAGSKGGVASASSTSAVKVGRLSAESAPSAGVATRRAALPAARFDTVALSVPAELASEPFNTPRTLTVPAGWSAQVWARVPGARFALWTPQHQLLVSTQGGDVVALKHGSLPGDPAQESEAITGLTDPQGLAFDTLKGVRVLYVAESNEVDRYVWKKNGTVGKRSIIVPNLPDLDSTG